MVEYDRSQSSEGASKTGPRICIVGIGGAGSNVVDRITLDRIVEATLICAHTDVRVLGHSMAPVKIQLGAEDGACEALGQAPTRWLASRFNCGCTRSSRCSSCVAGARRRGWVKVKEPRTPRASHRNE